MAGNVEAGIIDSVSAPRLYGQPMAQLPHDLYIPPDALEVILDAFEGPLDLLLYLIRRANIDVLDIPMAQLTAQYLGYVEAMRTTNLDLTAEYLVMAAILLEIKSRMLLPRPSRSEAEEADPRAELVRRLLEYEQMKQTGARLDELPQAGRDFERIGVWVAGEVVQRQPQVSLNDLQAAWLDLMHRARVHQHHRVRKEELSVREHMGLILRRLKPLSGFVEFSALFDVALGVAGLVVSFLAVLELVREGLIELVQRELFAPIYVRSADAATDTPD
ncbi:MAG: segregation/condensation protein A [Betaproteobacteria bacterium]|nr:segregation/condensation protein A [Betaproteobacteria bacterium]